MIDQPNDPEASRDNRIGEVVLERRIDHERDLILVTGNFEALVHAYREHLLRWENAIDDLGLTFMRQGLGASVLHLSCRPHGEVVGWTINIQQPPTNLFITGDTALQTVTGRVFTDDVRTAPSSRMFVQTSKPGSTLVQSSLEVDGLDVFVMFEQYYRQSQQTPARFFELDEHEYLMILGLPDADGEWLTLLTREAAVEMTSEDVKVLDHIVYRLQCGCSPARILGVVHNLYDDADELFGNDPSIEAMCPRCGRRWWISRAEFDEYSDAESQPEPGSDAESQPEPGSDAESPPEPGSDAESPPEPGSDAESPGA